jgi:hypothetical protein
MNVNTIKVVLLFVLALGTASAGAAFALHSDQGPASAPSPTGGAIAVGPQRPPADAGGPQLTLRSERQQYRPGEVIDLMLGVKNTGKQDFTCLNPPLNVLTNLEVTGPDGKKVAPVPNPPAAVAALPARSPFVDGRFIVGPGQTAWVSDCLRWINQARAETGAYIRAGYFPMQAPGNYHLRVRLGKVTSNDLVIKILDNKGLAESPAVRVSQVDFQTVVERTCPLPAPGGKQPLYLGLRVTNRGAGPLWFNKYDTLRAALTSADGKAVPLRAGQRLRSFVPAPLLVGPGKAETVLRCPHLEWGPDGKTLRLRGPDGAGGFWYFDGLRPGKYRVHFEYENTEASLLRSLRPQPGAGQALWLGKVTTASATFEILGEQKGARRQGDGLRLTLGSTRQEYRPGEAVDLILTVKNDGKEAFSYTKAKLQLLTGLAVTGPDGKEVRPVLNPVEIDFLGTSLTVRPGEAVTIKDADGSSLKGINLPKAGTGRYLRHVSYPMEAPGTYHLRFRLGGATSNELTIKVLGKGAAAGKVESPAGRADAGDARASQRVVNKGLAFQVVADPVWPVPGPGGFSPLPLQLRASNPGRQATRFVPILGTPVLRPVGGGRLKARLHGRDHVRRLPNAVVVEPGKAATAAEVARLFGGDKGLSLYWEDETGDNWSYDGLRHGTYLLSLHYRSTGPGGAWAGEAWTKELPVVVRELRASAPVVANPLRVRALADGTWPAPAAGKQSVIALGFRVTKVQQPTWARIIPRIASVRITAPDGTELPAKKVAAGLPRRVQQALHMNPDMSRSLAEPASLARAGRSLALTWADADGAVWQIAGLRPGTYRVRLVIRADKGRTPDNWTTWVGEVHTAAVEVTIKE